MRGTRSSFGMSLLLLLLSGVSLADDDAQLNDIYREFLGSSVDVEAVEMRYRDDIIHVGRSNTPLIRGQQSFMDTNILPLAQMVNEGQIEISGRAYIVRRIIVNDMANDVGYLYMKLKQADGEPIEQLQEFSWVFLKENGRWRVVTDFDGTPAPITLIESLHPQFTVE